MTRGPSPVSKAPSPFLSPGVMRSFAVGALDFEQELTVRFQVGVNVALGRGLRLFQTVFS